MHRGYFVWTPTPPLLGRRAPRPGSGVCVRVRALLARVGQAGLLGAFWCASPFLWPVLVRSLFVRPPPGWGCLVCGCRWVFFSSPSFLRPRCFLLSVFSGPGCLRPWRLVAPPFFFLCFSFVLWFLICPCCLWRFLISGPGCLGPRCLPAPPPLFLFLAVFFFHLLLLRSFGFLLVVRCGAGLCVSGCRVCRCVLWWCCPCGCSGRGALSPLWGWLVLCGVACCVWVFAVGLGCPLLSPAGSSCRVLVVLSLSGLVARRPVVWCGVSWCSAALCCVLWHVLSCGGVLSCSAVCLRRCLCLLFVSCRCASAVCVLGFRAVCSLFSSPCAVLCCVVWCPCVVLSAWSVLFLVPGVVGSWCSSLLLGVRWWLWLPGVVVWCCALASVLVSGLAVAWPLPCGVLLPCVVSCGAVLPCGAVLWCPVVSFFLFFFPCWWRWFSVSPFIFPAKPVRMVFRF